MRRAIVGLGITALLLAGCSGTATPPEDPQPDLPASETTVDATPTQPPIDEPTTEAPARTIDPSDAANPPPPATTADLVQIELDSPSTNPNPALPADPAPTFIWLVEPDGSNARRLGPGVSLENNSEHAAAWLADPPRIVAEIHPFGAPQVVTIDVATGDTTTILDAPATIIPDPTWSHVALVRGQRVHLIDGRDLSRTVIDVGDFSFFAEWHPNGDGLLLIGPVVRFVSASGELLIDLPWPAEAPRPQRRLLHWDPDGNSVVIGPLIDASIYRLRLDSAALEQLHPPQAVRVATRPIAALSSTGLLAISWATDDGSHLRIVPGDATATELEAAPDIFRPDDSRFGPFGFAKLSWSPSGDRLAFYDGRHRLGEYQALWIFDVRDEDLLGIEPLLPDPTSGGTLSTPRWSADGETIFVTRSTSSLRGVGPPAGSAAYDTAAGALRWERAGILFEPVQDLAFFSDDNGLSVNPLDPQPVINAPNHLFRLLEGPDGSVAALGRLVTNLRFAYSISIDGNQHRSLGDPANVLLLRAKPPSVPDVIFSPAGVALRLADGTILPISDTVGLAPAYWTLDGNAVVYRAILDDRFSAIIVVPTDGSGPYVLTRDLELELLGITPDGLVAYTVEFSCCSGA